MTTHRNVGCQKAHFAPSRSTHSTHVFFERERRHAAAQPSRLRDLGGRNARNFHVRALPRRGGVVLTVYHKGRGPKLRQRERDLRHHRLPPPGSSRAPLRAGRCGRSRRRTERFSFGQRHDAPLARALPEGESFSPPARPSTPASSKRRLRAGWRRPPVVAKVSLTLSELRSPTRRVDGEYNVVAPR